jgi:hypothetical protein
VPRAEPNIIDETMALLAETIKNLSSKVGGRDFMTPTELEKHVIPISVRQQTKMRYEKRFPIPSHKAGKAVFYHIEAIAEYVVRGKQETTTKITSSDLNTKGKGKIISVIKPNTNADDFDLSHAFFLKSILDDLKEELEGKTQFKNMLEKFIDSNDLHDELEEELNISNKNEQKKRALKV